MLKSLLLSGGRDCPTLTLTLTLTLTKHLTLTLLCCCRGCLTLIKPYVLALSCAGASQTEVSSYLDVMAGATYYKIVEKVTLASEHRAMLRSRLPRSIGLC